MLAPSIAAASSNSVCMLQRKKCHGQAWMGAVWRFIACKDMLMRYCSSSSASPSCTSMRMKIADCAELVLYIGLMIGGLPRRAKHLRLGRGSMPRSARARLMMVDIWPRKYRHLSGLTAPSLASTCWIPAASCTHRNTFGGSIIMEDWTP